jgi:hypothetical protein
VIGPLAVVLGLAAVAVAVAALIWAGLDRPVRLGHVAGAALVEVGLLVQAVIGVARLIGGTRPSSVATFVGYLAGSLVILPVGTLWALEERTRWSSVVLAVAGVTVALVEVRMSIVWNARG